MYIKSVLLLLLCVVFNLVDGNEKRMAIDIGSGSTKVLIAEIEPDNNEIVNVLLSTTFPVPYQAALDKSSDGTFDAEVQATGLKAFSEMQKLAQQYEVQRVVAVATSAFRKANNSHAFVDKVFAETSFKIQVITQRQEGEIAFFSATASGEYSPENVVVWDIGTGSVQMTTVNDHGDLIVYMGEAMGSVAFQSYIMDVIQDKDLEEVFSPNPMSDNDLKLADSYARAFGRKAYPLIKEKIKSNSTILGIGRLFTSSVAPLAANENGLIDRKGLRTYIYAALDKSDDDLDNPFAHVDVSNCILTLAIMKALHIHEIRPIDTTSTMGIIASPDFW